MFKMNFKGIGKLVIYGNGRIKYQSERDLSKLNNGELLYFFLSEEPKNARKENLNRKDCYFLKYTPEYCTWERRTALYIHESEISVSNPKEIVSLRSESYGETNYKNQYNLCFMYGATKRVLHCDRMNVEKNWTPPKGAHWYNFLGDHNNSYQLISDEEYEDKMKLYDRTGKPRPEKYNVLHWYYTEESFTEFTRDSDYYTRTEKTPDRKNREHIANRFTEILGRNNYISHYDIEKLLEHFEIVEK